MNDKNGRPYAKLSQIKPGDVVQIDAGFDCIEDNAARTVKRDPDGDLYIRCSHGRHVLDGQLSVADNDTLIGVYPVYSPGN